MIGRKGGGQHRSETNGTIRYSISGVFKGLRFQIALFVYAPFIVDQTDGAGTFAKDGSYVRACIKQLCRAWYI